MNQKQLVNKYKKINKDYGSTGRNLYVCTNNHHTIARHRDRGVTPMFIKCPVCGENSFSQMYRIPQSGRIFNRNKPGVPIHIDCRVIWVRPSLESCIELLNSEVEGKESYLDHILKGGLLFENEIKTLLQK